MPPPAYPAGDLDCTTHFATQQEVQAFYPVNGGPASGPHLLDEDRDGIACEWLP